MLIDASVVWGGGGEPSTEVVELGGLETRGGGGGGSKPPGVGVIGIRPKWGPE